MAGPAGLRLHPARQPPGLQGRDDRLQHELAGLSVPDPGSDPHHHDPDPQHHGASRLAQGRADLDVHLDRQDLAAASRPERRSGAGDGGRPAPRPLPRRWHAARAPGVLRLLAALGRRRLAPGARRPRRSRAAVLPRLLSAGDPRRGAGSPAAAAPLLAKSTLHAYVGGDPFAAGRLPPMSRTCESLARLRGRHASTRRRRRSRTAARAAGAPPDHEALGRPARRPTSLTRTGDALSRRLPAALATSPRRAEARSGRARRRSPGPRPRRAAARS